MGPPGRAGVGAIGVRFGASVGESQFGTLQQGLDGSLVRMHPAGKLRYFWHLENKTAKTLQTLIWISLLVHIYLVLFIHSSRIIFSDFLKASKV